MYQYACNLQARFQEGLGPIAPPVEPVESHATTVKLKSLIKSKVSFTQLIYSCSSVVHVYCRPILKFEIALVHTLLHIYCSQRATCTRKPVSKARVYFHHFCTISETQLKKHRAIAPPAMTDPGFHFLGPGSPRDLAYIEPL